MWILINIKSLTMSRDIQKKTITGAVVYFVVFTLFMFFVMGERNILELAIIGVVSSMILGCVLFYFQKKSNKK
jgi:hypothetical protein